MLKKNQESITYRVGREKDAHENKDVLGENRLIKEKYFSHTQDNKYFKRFNDRPYSLLSAQSNDIILEIGSGLGDRSIKLAKSGTRAIGIDISEVYVASANIKARELRLPESKVVFKMMDCHSLEFPDNYFDFVCGDAILHHLDMDVVLLELNRVLKPGGAAIFIEPLEGNPLLKVFRYFTPNARTIDEKPLSKEDLIKIKKDWVVLSEYYGILCAPISAVTSLLRIKNPDNIIIRLFAWFEKKVNIFNYFHPYNQYVLLHLVKKSK